MNGVRPAANSFPFAAGSTPLARHRGSEQSGAALLSLGFSAKTGMKARSASDYPEITVSLHRVCHHRHCINPGGGGPFMQPCHERFQLLRLGFSFHPDTAVRPIAYPAGNAQLTGL